MMFGFADSQNKTDTELLAMLEAFESSEENEKEVKMEKEYNMV